MSLFHHLKLMIGFVYVFLHKSYSKCVLLFPSFIYIIFLKVLNLLRSFLSSSITLLNFLSSYVYINLKALLCIFGDTSRALWKVKVIESLWKLPSCFLLTHAPSFLLWHNWQCQTSSFAVILCAVRLKCVLVFAIFVLLLSSTRAKKHYYDLRFP